MHADRPSACPLLTSPLRPCRSSTLQCQVREEGGGGGGGRGRGGGRLSRDKTQPEGSPERCPAVQAVAPAATYGCARLPAPAAPSLLSHDAPARSLRPDSFTAVDLDRLEFPAEYKVRLRPFLRHIEDRLVAVQAGWARGALLPAPLPPLARPRSVPCSADRLRASVPRPRRHQRGLLPKGLPHGAVDCMVRRTPGLTLLELWRCGAAACSMYAVRSSAMPALGAADRLPS